MKFQLGILAMLSILCEGVSGYTTPPPRQYGKYDITVWKHRTAWAGVIINNRFVLSADHFKDARQYTPKEMKVSPNRYVNSTSVIDDRNYGSYRECMVEKTWTFQSLLLIRTKEVIRFDFHVLNIPLPNKAQAIAWKDPCNIPNNVKFTTSYWVEIKYCTIYHLFIVSNVRKCSKLQQCSQEKMLVPTCYAIKTPNYTAHFQAGAPLVYNNTLVGIRKYSVKVDPSSEHYEDDFINVAAHMSIITDIIKGELKCYARN